MSDTEEKQQSTFEIDSLIKETYNTIAEWHNGSPDKPSLKQLSIELVEKIAGATLSYMGLKGNLTINQDEDVQKKIAELKKE